MSNCAGNCLKCGKCGDFTILNSYGPSEWEPEPRDGYGIAVDIGTTTVALALLNLSTGETIARHSFMNPQRVYGPDIISRIDKANNGKLGCMRQLITEAIETGIEAVLNSCKIPRVEEAVIAGNTVMAHLLLGLDCKSLGAAPFKPVHRLKERYEMFGTDVRIIPWLDAFVGGDIAAGLLYALPKGAKRFVLIDLGTNGEIALFDRGKLTVASTAAGPAFEGTGKCASDVLKNLAYYVRKGFVDETGLLVPNAPDLFSQQDIRNLQLAKSAVRSGLEILLEAAGCSYDCLDAVYPAGGIGQALDVDDAVLVGLLPPNIKDKARAIGNASLGGAARLLLSPTRASEDMRALFTSLKGINLAEHPRFNELFMEHMLLGE